MTKTRVFAVIMFSAFILTYLHLYMIDLPNKEARLEMHTQIVSLAAPAPYSGRLLVPMTLDGLTHKIGFTQTYALYNFLALALLLMVLYLMCRYVSDPQSAIIATCIAAASIATTFTHHYFQPWSMLEASLFGLILMQTAAIKREPVAVSCGIAILASLMILNRYTPLDTHSTIEYIRQTNDTWRKCYGMWVKTVIAHAAFWNAIPILAIIGYKRSSRLLKAPLLILPVYIAIMLAVRARVVETRPFMSMLPVVMPMVAVGISRLREGGR